MANEFIIKNGFYSNGNSAITGSLIVSASGANNDLRIGTNKLFVSASGNVGIGTTTPTAKLEVSGSFRFGPTGYFGSVYFQNWDYGTDMDISSVNTGGWARAHRITTSDVSSSIFFGVLGNATDITRAYWTVGNPNNGNNLAGHAHNTGIHLSSSGNVGIGIQTPTAKLTVQTSGSDDDLSAMIANFGKSSLSTAYGSTFIRVARYTTTTTQGAGDYTDIDHNSAGQTPHRYGTFGDTNIINGNRTTTGPYGNINFVTSGSTRMTITGGTSAGNVGIGITSPTATLHITNTSTSASFLVEDSANPDTTPFVINSSGDVGIGTTTPTAKLDIVYAASAGTGVLLRGGGGVLDSTPLKLWDIGTAINNRNIIEFAHNSTYVTASRIYSTNPSPNATTGGKLVLETTSDNIGTLNTSQLVLSNNGNVGIGTDTPTYTLQIQAAPTASIRLQETGSGGNKRLDLTIDGSGTARISANQSAQQMAFDTVNSERMRITSTGNVGINTTSPLGKLTVSGSGGYLSYNDTDSAGNLLVLSGSSDELVRIDVSALSASVNTAVSYGIRGVNDTAFGQYGKVTDGFMYASNFVNGLNIINYGEGTKEDYIRFYAGKSADGTTPDLHIQGSGSNKGFIGINKIDPNAQLDVNGSTIITGSLTVGNGTNTNLDPYGFVYGSGSYLNGSTASSAILGGTFNKIDTVVDGINNVILGGTRNIITGSNAIGSGHKNSAIIGGSQNTIHSSYPGEGEMIAVSNSSSISDANGAAIIATYGSNIIRTFQTPESVAIIAADNSEIDSTNRAAIIVGANHKMQKLTYNSVILGGAFHTMLDSVERSAIIGGIRISGSKSDTVYMPNAHVTGSLTVYGGGDITGSLKVSGSSELSSSIHVTVSSGSSSINMGVGVSKFIPFSYLADQTNIYTDKYIQISYDTSGTDPELTILTGPSAGRVQVHLFNSATAAELTVDLLTSTLTDIFTTGLLADTRLDCTISAGADSNWPFYRMTWFRSNTTYGGNIQVLIERFYK